MYFNVIIGAVNEMVLGQVVTFPLINCNIVTLRYVTRERQRFEKALTIVNRMAINKCFVINMIMFITLFARCFNSGYVNYCLS